MALNVFIGWSGEKGFKVAMKLTVWLKEVIPNVETWMSEDLSPGTVEWFSDLNERLRQADFAVICVNPDNWDNPWLSYEAGVVIGKTLREARVCPYLIDPQAKRRNLPQPLKLFWAASSTRDGTYQLVEVIHKAANSPVSTRSIKQLKKVFDKKWSELWEVIIDVNEDGRAPQPDITAYIDDFMMVSWRIETHRDRLYGRFHDVIKKAVIDIKDGTYDSEAIFELAAYEIKKSKERFIGDNSLLVGNVREFFESHYTEDDLKRVIAEIESKLGVKRKSGKKASKLPTPKELDTFREGLETHMQIAVARVFAEYHGILLGKLNNYLHNQESRN